MIVGVTFEKDNVLDSVKKQSEVNIIHNIKTNIDEFIEDNNSSISTVEKQSEEQPVSIIPKQDNGSLITNESKKNKLKNAGRYTKNQLITIALNNNINDIEKLTKQALYNLLKTHKTLIIE